MFCLTTVASSAIIIMTCGANLARMGRKLDWNTHPCHLCWFKKQTTAAIVIMVCTGSDLALMGGKLDWKTAW
jgi:hypothetical protein